MNIYQNYSDKDLIEAYTTMMDYSGKASDEMLAAIERRGGMATFLHNIKQQEIYRREANRITDEVNLLSKGVSDIEFIKKTVLSDILPKEMLEALIETTFARHQHRLADKSINSKTIIGSLAGAVVGSLVGGILLGLFIVYFYIFFYPVFYFLLIVVYIICYLIIKFITKQSRNNIVIFIASFLATLGAIGVGFLFVKLIGGI